MGVHTHTKKYSFIRLLKQFSHVLWPKFNRFSANSFVEYKVNFIM